MGAGTMSYIKNSLMTGLSVAGIIVAYGQGAWPLAAASVVSLVVFGMRTRRAWREEIA